MTPSPEMVQVPVDTAYESAPSPSPPPPVNVSVWPYTTVDVPSVSAVVWFAFDTVIDCVTDVRPGDE